MHRKWNIIMSCEMGVGPCSNYGGDTAHFNSLIVDARTAAACESSSVGKFAFTIITTALLHLYWESNIT